MSIFKFLLHGELSGGLVRFFFNVMKILETIRKIHLRSLILLLK